MKNCYHNFYLDLASALGLPLVPLVPVGLVTLSLFSFTSVLGTTLDLV
jgi:hypothetical protein